MLLHWFADASALLFAPSTIAVAAVVMAFAKERQNCSGFLRIVPDVCFQTFDARGTPMRIVGPYAQFFGHQLPLLDVNACATAMRAVPCLQSIVNTVSSPSSSTKNNHDGARTPTRSGRQNSVVSAAEARSVPSPQGVTELNRSPTATDGRVCVTVGQKRDADSLRCFEPIESATEFASRYHAKRRL